MGKPWSADLVVTAALLGLGLAVGGAGLAYPALQMLLGLGAVAAGAYLVLSDRSWRFGALPRLALLTVILILLLPLLQLLPLPPSLWQQLPGREIAVDLEAALGWQTWRPLTLDVEATVRAFVTLLPAAMVFIAALILSNAQLERLVWLVLGCAVVGALLGVVQLSVGARATPYLSAHAGYPVGLFVNRNHHAALLLVAMPVLGAVAGLQLGRSKARGPIILAALSALVVFAIVILATTSRMALILLPLSLGMALILLFRGPISARYALPWVFGLTALALLVSIAGGFDRTLARFASLYDSRFDYWKDVDWALDHYGLAGTGFGTFVPVFQTAESLESVGPSVVNHAHNDYLEILLEGGIPAVAVLLLFFGVVAATLWEGIKRRPADGQDGLAVAAGCGIALLLMFSLVDYPLRMPAIAMVFALLCVLLLQPRPSASAVSSPAQWIWRRRGGLKRRGALGATAALAVLAAMATVVVQAGISSRQLRMGRSAEAAAIAPWSTRAHEREATRSLHADRLDASTESARQALSLSPLSAGAVRSIGLIAAVRGEQGASRQLVSVAARLGWRDGLSQLWLIEQALATGSSTVAVQRAEALFRQGRYQTPALLMLMRAPQPAPIHAALAGRLASGPEWRTDLLLRTAQLPPAVLPRAEEFFALLGRSRGGISATEAQALSERLIAVGDLAAARRVWRIPRGPALLLNGDFERVLRPGAELPAEWQVSSSGKSRLLLARPSATATGNALKILDSRTAGRMISQRLMLEGGAFALSFRARAESAPIALVWELRCSGSRAGSAQEVAIRSGPWADYAVDLIVPNQDCPVQTLALRGQEANDSGHLWIDDIRISVASSLHLR